MHLQRASGGGDGCVARLDREPLQRAAPPLGGRAVRERRGALGAAVLGVVLTGMGNDGLEGARAIRRRGRPHVHRVRVVLRGLRHAARVKEAGLSAGEARVEDMAAAIVSRL